MKTTQSNEFDLNEFTPIPNYPDYYINESGEVLSNYSKLSHDATKKKPKLLKPNYTNNGYVNVNLTYRDDNGQIKRKCEYVHRLIGSTFLNLQRGQVMNHKNGIKDDNRLSNLEVCTYKQNTQHAIATGLHHQPSGPRYLMPIVIRNIETGELKHFYGKVPVAEYLGCTKRAVGYALNGVLPTLKGYIVKHANFY